MWSCEDHLGAKLGAKMSGSGHGSAWFGEDAIYFDHSGDCHDARYNKGCPGRWRGAVLLGYGPEGKRIRRKVSAAPNKKSETSFACGEVSS